MVGAAAVHAGDFRAAIALHLPRLISETGIHPVFGYRRGFIYLIQEPDPLIQGDVGVAVYV
jgi:hypothetical protein